MQEPRFMPLEPKAWPPIAKVEPKCGNDLSQMQCKSLAAVLTRVVHRARLLLMESFAMHEKPKLTYSR